MFFPPRQMLLVEKCVSTNSHTLMKNSIRKYQVSNFKGREHFELNY